MEKIDTDYKRRIWKIEAKLFNMRKPWLSSFKNNQKGGRWYEDKQAGIPGNFRNGHTDLMELRHGLRILKNLASIFQIRRL